MSNNKDLITNIDWRSLFIQYAQHVGEYEGTDFLDSFIIDLTSYKDYAYRDAVLSIYDEVRT